MVLDDTDRYTLHRQGRYLWARFKRSHRVLSTCTVHGGLREALHPHRALPPGEMAALAVALGFARKWR